MKAHYSILSFTGDTDSVGLNGKEIGGGVPNAFPILFCDIST